MAFISPDVVTSGSCDSISRLVTLRLTKRVSYTSTSGGGWEKQTTYYDPQDPYNQQQSRTLISSNQGQRVSGHVMTSEVCYMSDGMPPIHFVPCDSSFPDCDVPSIEIIEGQKIKESIWVSPKAGSSSMGQCSVFYIYKKDDTLGTCNCPNTLLCSTSSGANFRVKRGTRFFQETRSYQESRSLQKISSNYSNLNSPALGPINSERRLEITPECLSIFSTRTVIPVTICRDGCHFV